MKLPTRTIRDEGIRPFSSMLSPFVDGDNWDPFTEVATIRRTMNSILDSSLRPFGIESRATAWIPPIDVYEKNGKYHVECALPGFDKDDVDVQIADNRLTISGKREEDKIDEHAPYHYREIRKGSFSRTIAFPTEIDADNVSANYENGILKITVPSLKPVTAKKVAVKA